MDDFSASHEGHPIQGVFGNAKTGEQTFFTAGCAKAPVNGKCTHAANDETIFRMASMTKIMGGAVAAIAFEEGVVKPDDLVSKWIPEFSKDTLQAVTMNETSGEYEVLPLRRDITLWDLLGMKGGFGYPIFSMTGTVAAGPTSVQQLIIKPQDGCTGSTDFIGTPGNNYTMATAEDFIRCRAKGPQYAQPGDFAYYGMDYDVLGHCLGKAYGMDPETLMKTKLWEPLGMSSAMMAQAEKGDPRFDRVVELHVQGPGALPAYTPKSFLPAGKWKWSSELTESQYSELYKSGLGAHVGRFPLGESADGKYTGMSGYGGESFMTFSDYAKFLRMMSSNGRAADGARVLGPVAWNYMMSDTINEDEGMGTLCVHCVFAIEHVCKCSWRCCCQ